MVCFARAVTAPMTVLVRLFSARCWRTNSAAFAPAFFTRKSDSLRPGDL